MSPKLSVEEGIEYQADDLARYKRVLKPEVYAAFEKRIRRDNDKAKNGHDICRGQWLYEILINEFTKTPEVGVAATEVTPSRSSQELKDAFDVELHLLRVNFPMCYIEAWTPTDFTFSCTDAERSECGLSHDWNHAAHEAIAEALMDGFNANMGTTWGRVRFAVFDAL